MLIDGFTLFGSWPGLPYDHPVDHLIGGLERFRVDRACTLSSKGIFFDAHAGNEATWSACQQDARLIPIGTADPRHGGEEEVEFCAQQGFKLLALFPESQEWSLGNVSARNMLRRMDEAKMPVLVEASHEGDASAVLAATDGMTMPVVLLDVSLHTLNEAVAVLNARPRTYLATRLLCGGDTIEYLVNLLGPERLVFTSRFPISCFSSAFLTAKFASIDDAQRNAIMGGNIAGLL